MSISERAIDRNAHTDRHTTVRPFDVAIVGGLGHVGLPLGLMFAESGLRVCAVDINAAAVARVEEGLLPFAEPGCQGMLETALRAKTFQPTTSCADLAEAEAVIVVVGTPVDENLNPNLDILRDLVLAHLPYLRDGQLLVLRSTVYPGTSEKVQRWLDEAGKTIDVVFCPERIAEGKALEELATLPQLVSGFSEKGVQRARALFDRIAPETIVVSPIEAELAKLFSNAWRYIEFATANQFFMIANDHDVDFYRVYEAMTTRYPRMANIPQPGFAAGPCLFKDTMQLAAFNNNQFFLGHSAMLVNEGLPKYLVERLKTKCDLPKMTVGILGMTFKAESDDPRNSLSYKLKKIMDFEARRVLCTDVYLKDPELSSIETVLQESDVLILATPHRAYRNVTLRSGVLAVDLWNLWGGGCQI